MHQVSISEDFRRWVALNAGLCHARALAHYARHQLSDTLEAGRGEAACIEGARFLQQVEAGAGLLSWLLFLFASSCCEVHLLVTAQMRRPDDCCRKQKKMMGRG